MTLRLYYDDPALLRFDARIVERRNWQGRPAVVLDRSAFYPTSGGQPHDTGTLGGARVVDVLTTEDGEVLHVLDGDPRDDAVAGLVDGARRRDHRQHHSGQHILSRAFENALAARTIAFHLSATGADIDLDADIVSEPRLEEVETRANEIVWENRAVRIHYADTEEERSRFALRKEVEREGELRIIEIEGFDAAACGGTHVCATGEVGLIKIRKREKVGSRTRIHFLCGGRALSDYRRKNRVVLDLARRFSVDEVEVVPAVERLTAEAGRQRKDMRRLSLDLAERDARDLVEHAPSVGGVRIVVVRRDPGTTGGAGFDPAEDLTALAAGLEAQGAVAAALGAIAGDAARILMMRSSDVPLDLRPLLPDVLHPLEGKGGGRPESVQGAGPATRFLDSALDIARRLLQDALTRMD